MPVGLRVTGIANSRNRTLLHTPWTCGNGVSRRRPRGGVAL